jgi:hypothetical protein
MLQIIEHNPDDNDNNMQIAIRNNDMQLAALSDIAENQNDEVLSELSNHSHTLSIANSYKSDLNGISLNKVGIYKIKTKIIFNPC